MKKSTRIFSLFMALMMLVGCFSVMGSAYQAYKGNAVKYNDIDAATFTTEQYASMGLDEVDRMLAEEQLNVNVYIGTLDVTSIDNAVASLEDLLGSVSTLLGMLDDAADLSIEPLRGKRRASGTIGGIDADLAIVYSVFDFLSANAGIFEHYANGTFSLGILNSFVEEYVFNVRELLIGLVYGATNAGKAEDYDYFDAKEDGKANAGLPTKYLDTSKGMLILLQDLINELVLGNWELLDPYFDNKYDSHEEVMPGFYQFKSGSATGADVSDEAIDTGKYDYYGWVHPDNWVTVGLGDAIRVANGTKTPPAPSYTLMDITGNVYGYDFIEALLQKAFNYILVPVLNRDTVRWLKKECGYTFLEKYDSKQIYDAGTKTWIDNPDYDENYGGEAPVDIADNALYNLFETENLKINKITVAAGDTLFSQLDRILGEFVNQVLKIKKDQKSASGNSWTWSGNNASLFDDVCSVAKFVLAETGDEFLSSHVEILPASEIMDMNNQQVVSYIARSIVNASVEGMYIPSDCETVADVAYSAVEQILWQYLPQLSYTKPVKGAMTSEQYNAAIVDKILTMLVDYAAYVLNQELDMNLEDGNDPINNEGLLPYQGDNGSYEDTAVILGEWGIKTYGPVLALSYELDDGNPTIGDFWTDLDTIINAILPIKDKEGKGTIIEANISKETYVVKSLLLDHIIAPIMNLSAANLLQLLEKNDQGLFANNNGVKIIMTILQKVFDLLFPNVFKQGLSTIDALLDNETLGFMVHDLMKVLGTSNATGKTNNVTLVGRAKDIVYVALPIVCLVLGLSDDQEFGELENYMPDIIPTMVKNEDGELVSTNSVKFAVYNGTSGINTGYTDADGNEFVDETYTYHVSKIYANGIKNGVKKDLSANIDKNTIGAGESANVTISNFEEGMVVVLNIEYTVTDETGANMASLVNTNYAYVSSTNVDDDEIEVSIPVGNRKIKYEKEIYIATGDSLSNIAGHNLRIEDSNENKDVESPGTTGTVTVSNVTVDKGAFVQKNAGASIAFNGKGATYLINPVQIISGMERFKKNADGSDNGGIPVGDYAITATLNVAGTSVNVPINVHIYDDYGLDSIFSRAVAANRQSTDYDTEKDDGKADELWTVYTTALNNAATVALKPKNGSTFQSDIYYAGADADNKYELYANAITDAIEALSEYEKSSGTSDIEAALEEYSGINYEVKSFKYEGKTYYYKEYIEYTDIDNYTYFSYKNYVPHTYKRYREAKNNAEDLVNSQVCYVSGPLPADATSAERAKFDEEIAKANEFEAPVISAIESKYAQHMVELMGSRLIPLDGCVDKLNYVYTNLVPLDNGVSYTASSKKAFDDAYDFAGKVIAKGTDAKPSTISDALVDLVESWKMLEVGADYTKLNAAINNQATKDAIALGTPEEQLNLEVYTNDSYTAFYNAYQTAVQLVEAALGTSDQSRIDNAADALNNARDALKEYVADTASYSVDTTIEFLTQRDTPTHPIINDDMIVYYPDQFAAAGVDDLLYGVPFWAEMDTIASIFNTEGCTVEVTESEQVYYSCGTGALVEIKDSNNNVIHTYMVILRGDVDGDADVLDYDLLEMTYWIATVVDWEQPDTVKWYAAGDVNNDGYCDQNDYIDLSFYLAWVGDITQDYAPIEDYTPA